MSKSEVTAEEAAEILRKRQLENLRQCGSEIQQTLEKHQCRLVALIIIRDGRIASEVQIVAQ